MQEDVTAIRKHDFRYSLIIPHEQVLHIADQLRISTFC
jgi:hypothetical protein